MVSPRIFVAGHRGMVGSAVVRQLSDQANVLTASRDELDLTNQSNVRQFFGENKPQICIFAAARVGGIHANSTYPAEFIYQNLAMVTNAVHAAYENGCERFLFLGSTCIYPREAAQPIAETSLLTGKLETTNEAYAIAKIAGIKLCEFYRRQYGVCFHSLMPTNLYGPGDNYHPENSHVLPALIRRFHEAKVNGQPCVTIWGTGKPRREFLHVDDMASAVLHLMHLDNPPDLINVGTGKDISILEVAQLVSDIVGYSGTIEHDLSKPDGTMLKRTDTALINSTGWQPTIGLRDGIAQAYSDFVEMLNQGRLRSA